MQNTIKNLEKKVKTLEKNQKNITIEGEKHNQYGRRNNIEFEILEKIDVNVIRDDIEACHRLPPTKKNNTKKTII